MENDLPTRPALNPHARILVVLMGALGDVARGLVVVDAIHRDYPEVQIDWLVEPKCRGLVALHPGIKKIVIFDRVRWFTALPALTRELRAQRYDVVLDMQRHFKSGLFSLLTGAQRRIGFHQNDAKECNWLFSTEKIPERGEEIPKLDHYLEFVRALGITPTEPYSFGITPPQLSESLAELFTSRKTVGLVLGSSWRSKDWPVEGYEKLIALLHAKDPEVQIVLFGEGVHVEMAARLEKGAPGPVANLAGKTTLMELVGALARCIAIVGPDSGPMHLSSLVGVPYIGLFGPTSSKRVAPYRGERLLIEAQLGCRPCYRRECPGLGTICMRLLSAERVFDRLVPLLQP